MKVTKLFFMVLAVCILFTVIGCKKESGSITFWAMPNGPEKEHKAWLKKKADEFKKETGIEVKYEIVGWGQAFQKISTCVATGEGADVFQVGTTWNATFAVTNGLEEIDIDDFGGEEKFVKANLGTAKYKGTYYGVPWFAETRALFYNKKTFSELGLTPPKTLDELVEVGKKIIAKKGKGSAITIKGTGAWDLLHDWAVILWSNGGDILSKDAKKATINSEIAQETMEWYIDLVRKGLASKACAEYNQPQSRATFISESTAMIYCNPGDMAFMNSDNPKLKYGIVEPPAGKKGKASFAGGSNLVILKASKNKSAALKWAQFLSTKENAADYCKNITQMLPVIIDAFDDPHYQSGNFKTFRNILLYAKAYPSLSVWGDVEVGVVSEFSNILSDYVNGKLKKDSIKKYLDNANKKINAALAKEK